MAEWPTPPSSNVCSWSSGGCSPQDRLKAGPEPFASDWAGGFYCPCHGSLFDLAGRVYKNKPAPDNLKVPPYDFLSDSKIIIGVDKKEA